MLKNIIKLSKKSLKLFQEKRGTTIASSSTFYILLTIVPFCLLLIRVVGVVIGDINSTQVQIFKLLEKFFPDVAPEILIQIQTLVKGPLFAGGQFTTLNFLILLVTSLSFFNSIWNGLFLITEDKSYLNFTKHLKGIFVIGVTILLLCFFFFLPTLYFYIGKFMTNNIVINYISETFPKLSASSEYFSQVNFGFLYIIKTNFFHAVVFSLFFAFLYRWFFSWKLSLKQSFAGALVFSFLVILGKNIFWIYFMYVRDSLMRNYGDYYTLIVGIVWLYLTMSFFYFGACFCTVLLNNNVLTKSVKT